MTTDVKFKKGAAWLAGTISLGGIYFLFFVPSYYFAKYLSEAQNPLRHEYLQGIGMGIFISSAFWLPVAILLLYAKAVVPRWVFRVGVSPIIALVAIFIITNVYYWLNS